MGPLVSYQKNKETGLLRSLSRQASLPKHPRWTTFFERRSNPYELQAEIIDGVGLHTDEVLEYMIMMMHRTPSWPVIVLAPYVDCPDSTRSRPSKKTSIEIAYLHNHWRPLAMVRIGPSQPAEEDPREQAPPVPALVSTTCPRTALDVASAPLVTAKGCLGPKGAGTARSCSFSQFPLSLAPAGHCLFVSQLLSFPAVALRQAGPSQTGGAGVLSGEEVSGLVGAVVWLHIDAGFTRGVWW